MTSQPAQVIRHHTRELLGQGLPQSCQVPKEPSSNAELHVACDGRRATGPGDRLIAREMIGMITRWHRKLYLSQSAGVVSRFGRGWPVDISRGLGKGRLLGSTILIVTKDLALLVATRRHVVHGTYELHANGSAHGHDDSGKGPGCRQELTPIRSAAP